MRPLREIVRDYRRDPYMFLGTRIWRRLPVASHGLPPVRWFGLRLHSAVQRRARRSQNHSTFFFRNRPELALMVRLLDREPPGARCSITVLACSKGAEVYSIAFGIRSARPDLRLTVHAVDCSEEILQFAREGVYALREGQGPTTGDGGDTSDADGVTRRTQRDQRVSMFARMTDEEIRAMFDTDGDRATVKAWLREGIRWHRGDAGDPALVRLLGPQDVVVANRFLCHMEPAAAERCLRNIGRMVKRGGHLFVSGVDLDVRSRVAAAMGWKPVRALVQEIYEGDVSLMNDWPLEYWAAEPFGAKGRDRLQRYAAVFETVSDTDGS